MNNFMSVILEDPLTISLIIGVVIILAAYVAVKVHGNRMVDDDDDDLLMPVDVVYRDITDPVPRSRVQGVGKHEERKHEERKHEERKHEERKHEERKATPIYSGVLQYFPDALWEIAQCSQAGNDQHNAGEPLHWSRGKSDDHHDALTRHLFESGEIDDDGISHSAKMAWRALAILQLEIENREPSKGIRS